MKILMCLCVFLSIPLLAFAASKQPSSASMIKETGKNLAITGNILTFFALLRFVIKPYLHSKYSKQQRVLRNLAQKILYYHNYFALAALLLFFSHGVILFIIKPQWNPRIFLGILAILLFFATSLCGYFITKRRRQKQLFHNLHITLLLFTLATALLHIKYKLFAWLF